VYTHARTPAHARMHMKRTEEFEFYKVLLVKHELIMHAGPRVMEFTEQNDTQLVYAPDLTNLTVGLFSFFAVNC